ncbi:transglutaminase-like domain-containing protein [candidate division KSB1 bacterium]|nr:transglutaminase-like domain-containing protein [candidate division KSB1 bacterium]
MHRISTFGFFCVLFFELSPALGLERGPALERLVRFEHRQVNETQQPADFEFFLAIPAANERQEIVHFVPESGYQEILTDAYGNQILHYVDPQVPSGDVVAHGWMAAVRLYSAVYPENPKPVQSAAITLTPEQRALFIRDAANYQITSPIIVDLAQKFMSQTRQPAQLVRLFFNYLITEVHYVRDLVWDPAPMVIQRKSGSCSEYNYAFIALCRAAGIPCRYTGGIILRTDGTTRYDSSLVEDAVFHRWSEVLLPGVGWFPVDCSRGSGEIARFGNPYNQFGRLPSGVLQTMHGDGAGDSPLAWDYLSKEKVNFKTSNQEAKVGFWLANVPIEQLADAIKAVTDQLKNEQNQSLFEALLREPLSRELLFLMRSQIQPDKIPALIQALQAVRHPEAIYWSVLAQKRNLKLSYFMTFPFLTDEALARDITKYLKGTSWDLVDFEYWWRKARPLIQWHQEKGVFTLPEHDLNLF